MNEKDEEVTLKRISQLVFKDQADWDYIAARTCFWTGALNQFLWLSLQSIEKYLKGILLFNFVPICYTHQLRRLLDRIQLEIPYLSLEFSKETENFIEQLDRQGLNRYFERGGFRVKHDDFEELDRCIWEVRRYCCYPKGLTPGTVANETKQKIYNEHNARITRMKSTPGSCSTPCTIRKGVLEDLLQGRRGQGTREALLYKNAYFGSDDLMKITLGVKAQPLWSMTQNSPYAFGKGTSDELKQILVHYGIYQCKGD